MFICLEHVSQGMARLEDGLATVMDAHLLDGGADLPHNQHEPHIVLL